MKTTAQLNSNLTPQTDGVEVKLNMKSANLWTMVIFFLLIYSGSLLYCYVWEESSAYNVGYFIGNFWSGYIWQMTLLAFAANILSGYLILYFCNGRQTKAIRCHSSWSGVGYYSTRPVSLRWYRLFLLLPAILMGILPFLHGFCTGNKTIYAFGIFRKENPSRAPSSDVTIRNRVVHLSRKETKLSEAPFSGIFQVLPERLSGLT